MGIYYANEIDRNRKENTGMKQGRRKYIYICVCVCVCVYLYICIYIFIHTIYNIILHI